MDGGGQCVERAACSRAGNLVGPGPSEGLPRGLAYEGSGALPVGPAKARPGVAFLRGTTPPSALVGFRRQPSTERLWVPTVAAVRLRALWGDGRGRGLRV